MWPMAQAGKAGDREWEDIMESTALGVEVLTV